jgi:hypothetical protein
VLLVYLWVGHGPRLLPVQYRRHPLDHRFKGRLSGSLRQAKDVRGKYDRRVVKESMVWRWFWIVDVQTHPTKPTLDQRFVASIEVKKPTATAVDQHGTPVGAS